MASSASTRSAPSSVRVAARAFSSISKSPSRSSGITWSTFWYISELSSDGPEMISGVRASSIRMLSTSSTMAKLKGRWTMVSSVNFMLSRR